MGTPEFPNLGKHCSVDDCKMIDFLPFTCDRCSQVFCLEHRGYSTHSCPKANQQDVTVVVCPICAKGVRLIPNQDPNITWESHVNTDCDPANYQRVNKKKRCPVKGCRETLVFSNTIRCRDCDEEHCLKHRFGLDHNCPGPKKPDTVTSFLGILKGSKKGQPTSTKNNAGPSWWSNVWNSAESSMSRLSNSTNQSLQKVIKESKSSNSSNGPLVEQCTQCSARFPSVSALIEHAESVHQHGTKGGRNVKVTIDACPKCSKGFVDPVALVNHVEREHGGNSASKR
ncbi:AN1-type zinc finger protein 2B [Zostera marina]|uniref:AN1-type zinc finger protein 2B n=1 Tax=Zostera marina TaxID=29655 RepID=A0A0K9NX87_ZOSMR|nr:AN1-type zinc finger protein 2B [Zostera marina]